MTERFTEIVSLEKIKDNQTGKTYIGIVDSSFIGLVNGIVEEQEYLVFKSKQQRESIRVLLKENEQLKEEIHSIKNILEEINNVDYFLDDAMLNDYLQKIGQIVGVDVE